MRNRMIIFGSTDTGKGIYEDVKQEEEVLFFVDQDAKRWGEQIDGIEVKEPNEILQADYDIVYIGVLTYYEEVKRLLEEMGVPSYKVTGRYVEVPTYARIECLKSIRQMLEEDGIADGAVAELGVYQGEFAKEINRLFRDRKLYLFDTFEGFAASDCGVEVERGYADRERTGYFSNTTEQIVLGKMPYPEKVHICRGIFPGTTAGLEEKFAFVNLDADLYAPTLEGLKFFYPRMVEGGIILVHDYFSRAFRGVKDAVREYCKGNGIVYMPVGDTLSVGIKKESHGLQ